MIAFRFILRRPNPIFAPAFRLPTTQDIDRPLVVGSALFGIGWGIGGYCPGPGITALMLGAWNPILFVVALVAGSFLYDRLFNQPTQAQQSQSSSTEVFGRAGVSS